MKFVLGVASQPPCSIVVVVVVHIASQTIDRAKKVDHVVLYPSAEPLDKLQES